MDELGACGGMNTSLSTASMLQTDEIVICTVAPPPPPSNRNSGHDAAHVMVKTQDLSKEEKDANCTDIFSRVQLLYARTKALPWLLRKNVDSPGLEPLTLKPSWSALLGNWQVSTKCCRQWRLLRQVLRSSSLR